MKICDIGEVLEQREVDKILREINGETWCKRMINKRIMEEIDMKKSDLRSGMVVECRKGDKLIVIRRDEGIKTEYYGIQEIVYIDRDGYLIGSTHDDNLLEIKDSSNATGEWDIIKVFEPKRVEGIQCPHKTEYQELIWEREEPKEEPKEEVSVAERMKVIAEWLGVEIGEEFNVLKDGGNNEEYNPYKLTDEGMRDRDGDISNGYMGDLLLESKGYTIEKIEKEEKWVPQGHEKVWIVCPSYINPIVSLHCCNVENPKLMIERKMMFKESEKEKAVERAK